MCATVPLHTLRYEALAPMKTFLTEAILPPGSIDITSTSQTALVVRYNHFE